MHETHTIAIDDPRHLSVSWLQVALQCQHGWMDQGSVRGVDSCGCKECDTGVTIFPTMRHLPNYFCRLLLLSIAIAIPDRFPILGLSCAVASGGFLIPKSWDWRMVPGLLSYPIVTCRLSVAWWNEQWRRAHHYSGQADARFWAFDIAIWAATLDYHSVARFVHVQASEAAGLALICVGCMIVLGNNSTLMPR